MRARRREREREKRGEENRRGGGSVVGIRAFSLPSLCRRLPKAQALPTLLIPVAYPFVSQRAGEGEKRSKSQIASNSRLHKYGGNVISHSFSTLFGFSSRRVANCADAWLRNRRATVLRTHGKAAPERREGERETGLNERATTWGDAGDIVVDQQQWLEIPEALFFLLSHLLPLYLSRLSLSSSSSSSLTLALSLSLVSITT